MSQHVTEVLELGEPVADARRNGARKLVAAEEERLEPARPGQPLGHCTAKRVVP